MIIDACTGIFEAPTVYSKGSLARLLVDRDGGVHVSTLSAAAEGTHPHPWLLHFLSSNSVDLWGCTTTYRNAYIYTV